MRRKDTSLVLYTFKEFETRRWSANNRFWLNGGSNLKYLLKFPDKPRMVLNRVSCLDCVGRGSNSFNLNYGI